MTVLKPCIDCGIATAGARCPTHAADRKRARNRNIQTARAVVAAQPWCSFCGHRGSTANPLQSDHVTPLSVSKGGGGPQRTLCRRCNASRGDRGPSRGLA